MPASATLPEFSRPPLVEVVCGAHFPWLDKLKAAHLGLFWDGIRSAYPVTQDHPPVMMNIERPEGTVPSGGFRIVEVPPLPRVWFIDPIGNRVMQVQGNAFLFNWRKVGADDPYPRYNAVFSEFKTHFDEFRRFVKDLGIGTIEPVQFELSYINHIYADDAWMAGQSVEKALPDFGWRSGPGRFLPPCEALNQRVIWPLPSEQGRLHVAVSSGRRAGSLQRPIYLVELTARGMSQAGMERWFDLAHEWIVRGFTDLTSPDAHEFWGRSS